MVPNQILIELPQEIEKFLSKVWQPFMPPVDLREALEGVFAALVNYETSEESLPEYAYGFAINNMPGEIRMEEGDLPSSGPTRDRFDAFMRLGLDVRQKLLDYGAYIPISSPGLYSQQERIFPFIFEEVFSDNLVWLSKADIAEFGEPAAITDVSGPRYRL